MKKDFLTGLVILLPIAITVAVVGYLVNFFTAPFIEGVSASLKQLNIFTHGFLFLSHDKVVDYLSKLLILACLFIFIVILGFLARWYFIRFVLDIWNKILLKIPVVSTVYKMTQEIIHSFLIPDKTAFKQVVLVPFPRKGMYALGLIAGKAPSLSTTAYGSSMISVLLPTTPSPISGFILMMKQEELIYIDMKPEDAIKYIVSCGVLAPVEKRLS
ncbi:MAG: DUF502 domain-containing protein [Verrucomicrobia bacterium]|nr:DUF502 domain-containing protein [Verrucomicrobiota bacterium]